MGVTVEEYTGRHTMTEGGCNVSRDTVWGEGVTTTLDVEKPL